MNSFSGDCSNCSEITGQEASPERTAAQRPSTPQKLCFYSTATEKNCNTLVPGKKYNGEKNSRTLSVSSETTFIAIYRATDGNCSTADWDGNHQKSVRWDLQMVRFSMGPSYLGMFICWCPVWIKRSVCCPWGVGVPLHAFIMTFLTEETFNHLIHSID